MQQPRRVHDRPDARAAVKAAVMCEDVARTVHLARQLGEPVPIAPADIDALFDRYQNVYGQSPATDARRRRHDDARPPTARSGSSPGARASTATETLPRSPQQSQQIADALDDAGDAAGAASCGSRCSPTPTRSGAIMLEANAATRASA